MVDDALTRAHRKSLNEHKKSVKFFLSYKSRRQESGSGVSNVLHRQGTDCKCWDIWKNLRQKSSRVMSVNISGIFCLVSNFGSVQFSPNQTKTGTIGEKGRGEEGDFPTTHWELLINSV